MFVLLFFDRLFLENIFVCFVRENFYNFFAFFSISYTQYSTFLTFCQVCRIIFLYDSRKITPTILRIFRN